VKRERERERMLKRTEAMLTDFSWDVRPDDISNANDFCYNHKDEKNQNLLTRLVYRVESKHENRFIESVIIEILKKKGPTMRSDDLQRCTRILPVEKPATTVPSGQTNQI
jgi:hypothetical protein